MSDDKPSLDRAVMLIEDAQVAEWSGADRVQNIKKARDELDRWIAERDTDAE